MATRPLVFTVGRSLGEGRTEVLTSGFQAAVVTPETRISPAIRELQIGHRLRGTAEQTQAGLEVVELRPLEPDSEDAAALDALRARIDRAGVSTLAWGDSLALLSGAWTPSATLEPVDVERVAKERLLVECDRFPNIWWHDDPEPGILELEELLQRLGVAGALPRNELLEAGGRAIEASWSKREDGEARARLAFCRDLVAPANELLGAAGEPRRFFEFAAPPWEETLEPLWLLLTPPQAEGLVRQKVLRARKAKS